MQTSSEIRRSRLNQLVEKYGSIADLNQAIGWARTDPKLSQIKNNNKRPGRDASYQMGDAMAREIEDNLQLERGWMDNPQDDLADCLKIPSIRAMVMMAKDGSPEMQAAIARMVAAALEPTTIASQANHKR